MEQYLIFYDGTCGMCHLAVRFILEHDKEKVFFFAPLQGETASKLLEKKYLGLDSLVLLDKDKQILTFGKATLRILWLLGGRWKILGMISFLPSFFYDWIYKRIAMNRLRWFGKQESLVPINVKEIKDRFLP